MEHTSHHHRESRNERLGRAISRSVKYIIIFFVLLVVVGLAIVLFKNNARTKSLELVKTLERTDDEYESLISDTKNNTAIDDSSEEKVKNLIDTYSQSLDKDGKGFVIQETHYRIANLYLVLDDLDNATSHFESALKLGKSESYLQPKILANLAALSEERNLVEAAQSYYLQITDQYPQSIEFPHAQFSLGRIAEDLDNKNGTQTAQGIYISLIENEKWKNSAWSSLSKSRLAILGYTKFSTKDEANEDNKVPDASN